MLELLFATVFAGQILLISYYFPHKLVNRMRYVMTEYPPSSHAKLYIEPIEYYQGACRSFLMKNWIILILGFVLLGVLQLRQASGEWDRPIVFAFFMLQIYPIVLLDVMTGSYFKQMRATNRSRTRSASLQRRRLFDLVSPALVGLAGIIYVAFASLVVYVDQFNFPWFGGYWNIVGVSMTNLVFAGIAGYRIWGKKVDPYQSDSSRDQQLELMIKAFVLFSIAGTVWLALMIVNASLDLRHLEPIMTSLYCQLIVVGCFMLYRIDYVDFDVYRTEELAGVR